MLSAKGGSGENLRTADRRCDASVDYGESDETAMESVVSVMGLKSKSECLGGDKRLENASIASKFCYKRPTLRSGVWGVGEVRFGGCGQRSLIHI